MNHLHGTLVDKMKLGASAKQSFRLVRKNWKNYLAELLIFILWFAVILLLLFVLIALGVLIVKMIPMAEDVRQTIWVSGILCVLFFLYNIVKFSTSFGVLKITALYLRYTSEGEWTYQKRKTAA